MPLLGKSCSPRITDWKYRTSTKSNQAARNSASPLLKITKHLAETSPKAKAIIYFPLFRVGNSDAMGQAGSWTTG